MACLVFTWAGVFVWWCVPLPLFFSAFKFFHKSPNVHEAKSLKNGIPLFVRGCSLIHLLHLAIHINKQTNKQENSIETLLIYVISIQTTTFFFINCQKFEIFFTSCCIFSIFMNFLLCRGMSDQPNLCKIIYK